jgi:hypothetical protein
MREEAAMKDQESIPMLYQLMFGEHAQAAVRWVNGHFLKWAQAFDAWLEERKRPDVSSLYSSSLTAWRDLIRMHAMAPWSITAENIVRYRDWLLHERGYAPQTINNFLGAVSSFYEWCGKRGIDPQCGTDFNPAKGVPRLSVKKNHERSKRNIRKHCLFKNSASAIILCMFSNELLLPVHSDNSNLSLNSIVIGAVEHSDP